ncbi:MAG: hypothetical protein HKM24_07920 [Gammaproteobacteria bacterium]|nr:hypothetical protein [Gammaproteobacteria bacterium]
MDKNSNLTKAKLIAFSTHVLISLVIIGLALATIYFLWYPQPFLTISGGFTLALVLLGVDFIIGPILTLILYKPKKPGLMIDITMIILLQLGAFCFGMYSIYAQRPHFATFAVDRFDVFIKEDLELGLLQYQELKKKPWRGPLYALVELPTDPIERSRLNEEIFFEGKRTLETRAEEYHPFDQKSVVALKNARPVSILQHYHPNIESKLAKFGRDTEEMVFVPLVGRQASAAIVLDANTGQRLGWLNVDPWVAKLPEELKDPDDQN